MVKEHFGWQFNMGTYIRVDLILILNIIHI